MTLFCYFYYNWYLPCPFGKEELGKEGAIAPPLQFSDFPPSLPWYVQFYNSFLHISIAHIGYNWLNLFRGLMKVCRTKNSNDPKPGVRVSSLWLWYYHWKLIFFARIMFHVHNFTGHKKKYENPLNAKLASFSLASENEKKIWSAGTYQDRRNRGAGASGAIALLYFWLSGNLCKPSERFRNFLLKLRFGLVLGRFAILKKIGADYEHLLRTVFSCFQGHFFKNIVASALKWSWKNIKKLLRNIRLCLALLEIPHRVTYV